MTFDELSASTKKALASADVRSLEQLVALSEEDLCKIPNIGAVKIREIEHCLRANRLMLKPSVAPLKYSEVLQIKDMVAAFRLECGIKFVDDNSDRRAKELSFCLDRLSERVNFIVEDFEFWETQFQKFQNRKR
ncbi:DNA-directed RNA polymerase subunit alpha C-terminal domain-containing protein [Novosphingobium sp.]|uniref:DNA-directed RNA polymerase subunit alpha C-terminal domain-containing protein n=1 Tax=Novosphingobium sp. TaxID=1874826 RepID=UPI0026235C9D|nr:DNA-directed RNA polymerase subunit alpha C-terminal domain-containing protein [Novosphingobium sp.]